MWSISKSLTLYSITVSVATRPIGRLSYWLKWLILTHPIRVNGTLKGLVFRFYPSDEVPVASLSVGKKSSPVYATDEEIAWNTNPSMEFVDLSRVRSPLPKHRLLHLRKVCIH